MGRPSTRRVVGALALALLATLGVWIAASGSLRAKIAAAYRAFADPSRVRPAFEQREDEPPPAPAAELDQPEVGLDFEKATEADFGDAGTLESLTLPDLP